MDSTETVTHIGLCAGYGGIELGLKRAIPSLRTVALCEIEAFAIANLVSKMEAGLMDPAPIWPDLKTFPWEAFRDRVDILTGGYPCQPFSAAGKRLGGEDPRHLWPHISRGISILQPRVCFFENVEGHITCGLHHVLCDLGRLGYRTTWGIFSASECGAPHQRKRVFIMANRCDKGLQGREWFRETGTEGTPSRHASQCNGSMAVASGLGGAPGLSGPFPRHEGQPRESDDGGDQAAWPSRPGEQQYGWEPPRVVGDTESEQDRGLQQPGVQADAASAGQELANSHGIDRSAPAEGRQHDRQAGSAGEELVQRQTQSPLGGDTDGPAGGLDYAELCVTCDNRTDELRLLGNGVVPATAERACRILMQELDTIQAVL